MRFECAVCGKVVFCDVKTLCDAGWLHFIIQSKEITDKYGKKKIIVDACKEHGDTLLALMPGITRGSITVYDSPVCTEDCVIS